MAESYSVEAILTAVDSNFSRTMDSANSSLKSLLGYQSKGTAGMGSLAKGFMVGNLAAKLVSKGIQGITANVGKAVDRFDTMNTFPKMMTTMGYSTKEANKAIKDLGDGIEGLPTTLDSVTGTTQQLALLTGDLKKSTKLTLALNNAFLASGSSSADASRGLTQYSQMLSKGKVDQQSWNTLLETMPTALTKVAESFGYAGASAKTDLYDALKDGTITFDEFNDKLMELNDGVGGFAEMAKINSEGIKTSFGNISNAVAKGLANTMSAIDRSLESLGFDNMAKLIDKGKYAINDAFKALNGDAEAGVKGLIDVFTDNVKPFQNEIKRFFSFDNVNISSIVKMAGAYYGAWSVVGKALPLIERSVGGLELFSDTVMAIPGKAIAGLNATKSSIAKFASTAYSKSNIIKKSADFMADGYTKSLFRVQAAMGRFDGGKPWASFEKLTASMGKFGNGMKQVGSLGVQAISKTADAFSQLAMAGLQTVGPVAMIGVALAGAGLAYQTFGTQIDMVAQMATTQGPAIISNLADGIISQLPTLIDSGVQMLQLFADAFSANFPVLVQKGVEIISSLVQGVGQNIPQLISIASQIVSTFVGSIVPAIAQLTIVGMQFILQLAQGIVGALPQMLSQGQGSVSQFIQGALGFIGQVMQIGFQIISTLISGLMNNLPQILSIGVQAITQFIQGLVQMLPTIINYGVRIIRQLITGIVTNFGTIISTAAKIILVIVSGLLQALPQIVSAGAQIIVSLLNGITQLFGSLFESGFEIASKVIEGIKNGVANLGSAAWDGLKTGVSGVWDWVTGKSAEGSTATVENVQTMEQGVTESTALMNQNVTENVDSMSGNLQTKVGEMSLNIPSQFETMAQMAGLNFQQLGINLDTEMANIQANLPAGAQVTAEGIKAHFANLGVDVPNDFAQMAANAMGAMSGFDVDAIASAGNTVNQIVSEFGKLPPEVTPPVDSAVQQANASFNNLASEAPANVSSTTSSVSSEFTQMEGEVTGAMTSMESSVSSGFTGVGASVQSFTSQMNSTMTSAMNSMKTSVQSAMNSIKSNVQSSMNSTKSVMTSSLNSMKSQMQSAVNSMKSTMQNAMSSIKSVVSSGMNQVVSAIRSAMQQAVSAMRSAAGQARSAGYQMGAGFLGGLNAMSGAIIGRARAIASAAAAAMRSALRIHSPSRVTAEIGGYFGKGLAMGIDDETRKVEKIAANLALSASSATERASGSNPLSLATTEFRGSRQAVESLASSRTASVESLNQPAEIYLNMGGTVFKAFTQSITHQQELDLSLSHY